MSKFQVGDLVKYVGNVYVEPKHGEVYTIYKVDDYSIAFKDLAGGDAIYHEDYFELVASVGVASSEFNSVIQTVTKKEIVNGKIRFPRAAMVSIAKKDNDTVYVQLGDASERNRQFFNVEGLRKLARLANELADILEGK